MGVNLKEKYKNLVGYVNNLQIILKIVQKVEKKLIIYLGPFTLDI